MDILHELGSKLRTLKAKINKIIKYQVTEKETFPRLALPGYNKERASICHHDRQRLSHWRPSIQLEVPDVTFPGKSVDCIHT